MADKYCDVSLASCEFDGYINNATLNVTKVYWGTIGIGAVIVAKDLSFTTTTPQVSSVTSAPQYQEGTYALNVSISSLSSNYRFRAYGGAMVPKPPVGFVQDGDGTGSGRGTVATVTINLAGYSATAGNTFTIGGATLTGAASATTNVFAVGSGATLALNLANAINNATNTVVVTGAGNPMLGWRSSQLRSVVYAYQDPTTTTLLKIQTRCASAAYNATTFFQCVSSGFTGGVQFASQFSGGGGGAWQQFLAAGQNFTIEGGTAARYGAFGDMLLAGTLDPGDKVYIRASDDENSDVINYWASWNNGTSHSIRAMGSLASPVEFIVDDGTKWATTNPTPTFRIKVFASQSSSQVTLFGSPASGGGLTTFCRLIGKRYASTGKSNFSYEQHLQGGLPVSPGWLRIQPGMYTYMENLDFNAGNNPSYPGVITFHINFGNNYSYMPTLKGLKVSSAQTNYFFDGGANSNSAHGALRFVDCDFDNTGNPSAHTGVHNFANQYACNHIIEFDNVRFNAFGSNSRWCANAADGRPLLIVRSKNVDYGNISVFGPNMGTYSLGYANAQYRNVSSFTQYGKREFFVDTMMGFCDWTYARGYPTLNAKLLDGVTPWVIHATTSTIAGQTNEFTPFILPRIAKINTLDDGVRTFTVNFAVNDSLAWNTSHIGFEIEYEAVDGTKVYQSVYDRTGGTAFTPAPEATWTLMSGSKIYYDSANHTPYKMVFTTAANKPIKKGGEIAIYPKMYGTSSNNSQHVFFCPEILVS